jgi:hypothetical protein
MFLLLLACSVVVEPQVSGRFLCAGAEALDIGSCPITLATCLDTVDQDCFLLASSCHGLAMLPVSCPDHT